MFFDKEILLLAMKNDSRNAAKSIAGEVRHFRAELSLARAFRTGEYDRHRPIWARQRFDERWLGIASDELQLTDENDAVALMVQ
jgi:hypothetical protein